MIGTTVSHYRVLEKLGAGGMREVYRAEDTTLGRHVAIKVLPDVFREDAERLARFEREAQPQARRKPWHAVLSSSHEVGSPRQPFPSCLLPGQFPTQPAQVRSGTHIRFDNSTVATKLRD